MHKKLSKRLLHLCCFLKIASLIVVSVSWNGLVEGGYPAAVICSGLVEVAKTQQVGWDHSLQGCSCCLCWQGCTFSWNGVSYAHTGAVCVSLPKKGAIMPAKTYETTVEGTELVFNLCELSSLVVKGRAEGLIAMMEITSIAKTDRVLVMQVVGLT